MNWVGNGTRVYLVTVDDVLKLHTYISGNSYDALLTEYIKAATDLIEKYINMPLSYPAAVMYGMGKNGVLELPKNTTAVNTLHVLKDNEWVEVFSATKPTESQNLYSIIRDSGIKDSFHYKAALTLDNTAVNENIKQVCRLLVAEMFENRENKFYKGTENLISRMLANEASLI